MNKTKQKMLVVIPMKELSEAKSRLRETLSTDERSRLAMKLFRTVLSRLEEMLDGLPEKDCIDVAVISSSALLKAECEKHGVLFFEEGERRGLSEAAAVAAERASALGYDAMCLLPGDLADPHTDDLKRLLTYPVDSQTVLLCPSVDLGTNGLVVPLPCPITFHYGEKSFYEHYRSAADNGLMPVVLPLNSLRQDVDTVADLRFLQSDISANACEGGAN